MSFQSAQTNFKGQNGWNDLDLSKLELDAAARANKGRARPRRVFSSQNITESSQTYPSGSNNQSPAPSKPPSRPPSRPPSALPSATSLASMSNVPPPPPSALNRESLKKSYSPPTPNSPVPPVTISVSIDDVKAALNDLANRPSNFTSQEVSSNQTKIESCLPTLETHHLDFIVHVLRVASKDGKSAAKDQMLKYAVRHNNVMSWCLPLRRLIENQK